MNWNDLELFLAIAEAGTLAGAARSLRVNHSTVFRRLNTLEADLDTRLFDRQPEGYALTPAGEKMLAPARQAQAAVQSIELDIAGQDLQATGTVRLTTAPNIARTLVPPAVRALRDSHPGIRLEVLVGDTDYDLGRRQADIALRATTRPPEQQVGRRLVDLAWWVCRPAILGDEPPVGLDELSGRPMIGADHSMMRLDAFQWLEAHHASDIVTRANDLTTMGALARAGVGYALLPADQAEPGLDRLFTLPGIEGQLWLLTHPDLRRVRRIDAVWNALVETTRTGLG
ncbi:LysR family transcriptional regulator [Marinihelvus fidelis]|uniref:LysR family transcriptional regulator n=1 Tax=Marinihelvus fidelis TaxID=2613842 RepID=A0A5N0T7R5_9GAMM|nr:LysR family transcriptional regulator [Marinihelvus fidelis]KAA9130187.1 LysR family transcriptional regulator [Marinihelvus fidelis]